MYQPGDKVLINASGSRHDGQLGVIIREVAVGGPGRWWAVSVANGEEVEFPGLELLPAEEEDVRATQPRAYLAGPITNEPSWREYFAAAEDEVREMGYVVLSPAENGAPGELDREECMTKDFALILKADAVFMLPGWENSQGALVEFQVAQQAGKQIKYLDGAFRGEPLELTASKLVRNGERERTYGHPIADMERFTIMLTGLLQGLLKDGVRVPASYGPLVMLTLKLSRAANDPTYIDTRTDLVGWSIVFDRVMQTLGGNHS